MSGALSGIKVLDLSRLLPGGFCSLLLADFGAEVLKVEDTGMGDYIRWAPPYHEGAEESAKSALFLSLNRGKRSIRIDLKDERGREVLLRLAREYDVLLESFRPGVLDRLGVGYERLREENPGLVYCAITGYGQDGPYRDRSGHDMNYLGLVGLLGLTGEDGGPPIQSAGQIADLGGGALMAAFGIMAALRERDRSGKGQLVDISMADGSLSWLAMVAARHFADGQVPRRGGLELAGAYACYRPYPCSDGWVTLGALEPKFWQAWCRGVGRDDLVERQFDPPGSEAHGEVERIFMERTREQWRTFASEVDCCLEPVLDLDEALASELVRAREMVVEVDQPGAERAGAPAGLAREDEPHPSRAHRARPFPGPAHGRGAGRARLFRGGGGGPRGIGRGGRARRGRARRLVHGMSANGMLRMGELAEASGVSAGTIKHYLREGLLPEPVKTSRNMAWYPPEFVQRIRLIKQLQEERFMPLKAIKSVLDEDPERARALVELEDRILERALSGDRDRVSAAEVRRRYDMPREVLDRLAEIGLLSPDRRGYSQLDLHVIEAIGRFRAGGYDEQIGFTVYDTLRYKHALEALVEEEVQVVLERLAGELEPDRVVDLIEAGAEPLRDFIAALHSKLLVEELKRHRESRG